MAQQTSLFHGRRLYKIQQGLSTSEACLDKNAIYQSASRKHLLDRLLPKYIVQPYVGVRVLRSPVCSNSYRNGVRKRDEHE